MIKKSLSALALLAFIASNAFAESVPTLQTDTNTSGAQGVASTQNQNAASQSNLDQTTSPSKDGLTDLFFMVQQLQDQVQQLTGQVQEQAFELKQLKSQGLSRYRDLDGRILSIQNQLNTSSSSDKSSVSVPVVVSGVATPNTQSTTVTPSTSSHDSVKASIGVNAVNSQAQTDNPSGEQLRAYNAAFENIKSKNFDKAVDDFHAFINKYPKSVLAGNAYYWLGEVYLVKSQFDQAKDAFTIVAANFPNHSKAPDALFKLGVTYHQMGDEAKAKSYLNEVVNKYPDSSASRLATEYLKKL
jgi:tol-pal system protein YbgF